jgi:hypothetical protein
VADVCHLNLLAGSSREVGHESATGKEEFSIGAGFAADSSGCEQEVAPPI